MKINIQDFCNSHGLITNSTASSGLRKTATREGISPIPSFEPSTLWYNTGNFTGVNTSVVKSLIGKWAKANHK